MRLVWKGKWKNGEITVETETVDDLTRVLQELTKGGGLEEPVVEEERLGMETPEIPGHLGCSDAVRAALRSPWGRKGPRTMAELISALEANAIYFSKGTISGALSLMTKRGALRRVKKNGKWAYVLPEKKAEPG